MDTLPGFVFKRKAPEYWYVGVQRALYMLHVTASGSWDSVVPVGTVIGLRAEWFGVRISSGTKYLSLLQNVLALGPTQPPNNGHWGLYGRGVTLITVHLVPKLRMNGVLLPLSSFVFMACAFYILCSRRKIGSSSCISSRLFWNYSLTRL
jgi:hypothetical protein